MDAFAVSMTNGITSREHTVKIALKSGLAFGFFQMLMPLVGYFAGSSLAGVAERFANLLALLLLSFIGLRMVWNGLKPPETGEDAPPRNLSLATLGTQALATSIDALAVGAGLGVIQADPFITAGTIGLVTFTISFAGVLVGKKFGSIFNTKAEMAGGLILIFIGIKIFFGF